MLFITRLNAKLPNDRDLLLPKQDSLETRRQVEEGEGAGEAGQAFLQRI